MAFSFEFCMSVLTKIAAAVGHQVLGPLLVVVVLLLRRRWLMVPIIAEAVLRPVLMGVVLMLGHRVVLLRMMVVMLMVALMGGWHGIVHITAAIYIGVRVAGRWWGGHYTRHARTDCTTQTHNTTTHNTTTATTTVSTAVGHHGHGHLVLNGGQCGIAAEIVTMPFARESGQGGWCAGGLGKSGLSANASMAVTCGRGRGLHFRLLSG